METSSALLAICTGEFPTQRPVTRSFDVFFDLRLNKQLNKQSWGWWFETLSHPLWRHSNVKNTELAKVVKILPHGRQEHVYLHYLYHECRLPGAARSQGIRNNGIDQYIPEYSSLVIKG